MLVPETEVLITCAGQELLKRVLRPGDYVLGRSASCDLSVQSGMVSRRHARLTINFSSLFLEDLGSFNGTTVNGGRISGRTQIWHGQRILLGDVSIELRKIITDIDTEGSLAPAQSIVLEELPENLTFQASGYKIGHLIGRGGMGAVLQAEDASIQRQVAMKVVLHGDSTGDVMRFIHEARITGQLEHPNIIPVHTFGADEHGQPFYTMKLVQGVTLKDVVKGLAAGDEETIRTYPLSALLSILDKVCDGMRFAHSQNVIHRDLKPDNIMLGSYGEVLILDWGLAKKLGVEEDPQEQPSESDLLSRSNLPSGVSLQLESNTLTGAVLGTPQYMPPEQAEGNVDGVDQRADIYSLGAILYNVLTLLPPFSGTPEEVLDRVIRGEIATPSEAVQMGSVTDSFSDRATERVPLPSEQQEKGAEAIHLPHLPAGHIPKSLEAVVLKAMARDAADRYQTIAELQQDLQQYQQGFATNAEHANLLKVASLWVKRNRGISIVAAVALSLVLLFAIGLENENRASAAVLKSLRGVVPMLAERTWLHLEEGRLQEALEMTTLISEVDSKNPDYLILRGRLLQGLGRLNEAQQTFEAVLKLRKDHVAEENRALCKRLTDLFGEKEPLPLPAQAMLVQSFNRQNRLKDAKLMAGELLAKADELAPILEQRLRAIQGWEPKRLRKLKDGTFAVDLSALRWTTLDPLEAMPVSELTLDESGGGLPASAFEALQRIPLRSLSVRGSDLKSIAFLKGIPVERLVLANNPVTDISMLAGLPIQHINLADTNVRDLSALESCPLLENVILPKDAAPSEGLRAHGSIRNISFREAADGSPAESAKRFWKDIPETPKNRNPK